MICGKAVIRYRVEAMNRNQCEMSELLDKAIAEIHALSEEDQDAFATLILEELASERRWQQLFADSEDLLSQLADEALAEHRAGKTRLIDPDQL